MKKAISIQTYKEFICDVVHGANGVLQEAELDAAIKAKFLPHLNECDAQTDRRGVPRWRQYVASAKAELSRSGECVAVRIGGIVYRSMRKEHITLYNSNKGKAHNKPGYRFHTYRRSQPPTRTLMLS